jgi:hypothetical protein
MLFPGTAADIPAYTVKVHAKFPEQQPAIRGVLCLCDGQTGELLAVMDSTHQDSGAKTSNSSTAAEKIIRLVFGYRVINGALCYLNNHRTFWPVADRTQLHDQIRKASAYGRKWEQKTQCRCRVNHLRGIR